MHCLGSPNWVPRHLPGASKCGALFFGTPPEASKSHLWSSQAPPRTPLRAPKDPQGPPKSAKSTIKKRRKYVYLALKNHENSFFS